MESKIKKVAIYLRKSRADEAEDGVDVLQKHREYLYEYCKEKGWEVLDEFAEIGSSDTIEHRQEFNKLLEKVALELYDAVVVMDLDRITRGDDLQRGLIKKVFRESNTLIAPYKDKIIDFSDEEDLWGDMKAIFARYELIQTKKRLRLGKLKAIQQEKWANGPAPYGYKYNRKTKKLEINVEEAEVFRFMVDCYLQQNMGIWKITRILRQKGVRTRRSKPFHDNTIRRMFMNQVYLGKTVFWKTEGSLHKNRPTKKFKVKDPDEWIVIDNTHLCMAK